jgi:hypothetical protein
MNQSLQFKIFFYTVLSVVTAAVVVGLFFSGPPSQERARNIDMTRVNDLQQIAAAIDQYYNFPNTSSTLPSSLDDLVGQRNLYIRSTVDPETGIPYEYLVKSSNTYDLCATFSLEQVQPQTIGNPYPPKATGMVDFWNHPAGHKCYEVKVQKWPR